MGRVWSLSSVNTLPAVAEPRRTLHRGGCLPCPCWLVAVLPVFRASCKFAVCCCCCCCCYYGSNMRWLRFYAVLLSIAPGGCPRVEAVNAVLLLVAPSRCPERGGCVTFMLYCVALCCAVVVGIWHRVDAPSIEHTFGARRCGDGSPPHLAFAPLARLSYPLFFIGFATSSPPIRVSKGRKTPFGPGDRWPSRS